MDRKITCLIVDDEPIARSIIEDHIKNTPFLELVASCAEPFEAMTILQDETIDLLFSDIQMPKVNGLEMVRSLPSPPAIIFITAHDQFAVESYELNITDYLLKPVTYERFLKAVNKAKLQVNTQHDYRQDLQKEEPDHFFIKQDKRLVKILFKKILYIEASKDFVFIHTSDGDKLMINARMKEIAKELPLKKFFRIHHSYLVNIEAMKAIQGNIMEITGGELPIARDRKEELLDFLHLNQKRK